MLRAAARRPVRFRSLVLMLVLLVLAIVPNVPRTRAAASVKAQYRTPDTSPGDNAIKPHLQIVNTGTAAVTLSTLKARYYYSKEGTSPEQYWCDWAQVGCANVTGTFAAGYLEVGFTSGAGSLAAGASTGEIQSRFNKTDWSNYTETGDYSYDPTKTSFADWSRVTIYESGALVWGTPPGGTLPTNPPATVTRSPTLGGATATRTRTATVGGATATRTRTATLGGATATRTRTPTLVGPTATRVPTQGGGSTSGLVGYATLNGGTTGGAGGPVVNSSTGTQIHQALCGRPSNDSPIIIRVSGTINHGNTTQVSGSCSTAAGVIEIKDVSNITIVGVGSSAIFDQIGIHIRNSRNIIIQNVHVRNVKKSGSPISNGGDAIGMESNVSNVWVDHCTLEASGGESEGYDGLFDMKNNTKYVTLSYSHLLNSERGGLVGSGDSDSQNNYITYHHNHYQNLNSRVPLLRFATAHAFNNFYNGIVESGMNPRIGGRIKAENNLFENAKDPLGTFYTDDMGYWDVSGNIWGTGVTWSAPGDSNHPAGPNVVSTTSISIPYAYSLDPASSVKSIVLSSAGVGKI